VILHGPKAKETVGRSQDADEAATTRTAPQRMPKKNFMLAQREVVGNAVDAAAGRPGQGR